MEISDYKAVISIMHCRLERNKEEHENIKNYIKCCTTSNQKPKFIDLIEELGLTSLSKYKKQEMRILQQIFSFYVDKQQYR